MNLLGGHRGLMGLTTLIILMATIVVAATATALLIYFGANLQNRAVKASDGADSGSNGIMVDSVVGTDGSAGKDIEHFEVVMKLQPGSDDINLNTTLIVVNSKAYSQSLDYNDTLGDNSSNAATTSDYTVEWLKQGSNYKEGYLSRGDIAKVRFNYYTSGPSAATGGIGEDEEVEVKVIPRFGSIAVVRFTIPMALRDQREPLYPKDGLI